MLAVLVTTPSLALAQPAAVDVARFPLDASQRAILCGPRADLTDAVHPLRILQSEEGPLRRMYAPDETLVVSGGSDDGLAVGQLLLVRRSSLHRLQPRNLAIEVFGIRTLGVVTIEAVTSHVATARAVEVCEGFVEGDWLDPYTPVIAPAASTGTHPDYDRTGVVLFGDLSRQTAAPGEMVVVDRGANDAVSPGAAITVFRETVPGGPIKDVAIGLVVDVGEATATVRIEQARDAVFAGDRVAFHAPPN